MKSRASCFDAGLAKNLLRRFWPLWLCYLAALLLSFVIPVSLELERAFESAYWAETNPSLTVLRGVQELQVGVSFVTGVLAAMAMYGYLYNSRSCGMMHALPLRRETLFVTAFVTGLVPMLLAQVLSALLGAALGGRYGAPLSSYLLWLGLSALLLIAFYGFAVFCAMLTGNVLVLPAVYAVLNCTALVAEASVRALLAGFRYGDLGGGPSLSVLSPLVYLMRFFEVYPDAAGPAHIRGLGVLLAYAAAGLALSALALLLYRRRRLECAGDVVAVPILKPVFQYCMAFGTAAVLPALLLSLLDLRLGGRATALLQTALMLLGAFLGWYAAEMLIEKTLQVFFRRWKGLALVCALLLVFAASAEFDLFGYERRIPEAGEVEELLLSGSTLSEPENIAEALELHRSLVQNKQRYDSGEGNFSISFSYTLQNGKRLSRSYRLPFDGEPERPLDEDMQRFQDLLNCPEAVAGRVATQLPPEERCVSESYLELHYVDDRGYMSSEILHLTPAQALELYQKGVLADAAQGHIGLHYVSDYQPGSLEPSNMSFFLELAEEDLRTRRYLPGAVYDHLWLTLYMESEHCLQWIRENTELAGQLRPQRELEGVSGARHVRIPG